MDTNMKLNGKVKKVLGTIGLWFLGKIKDFWEEKLKEYLHEEIKLLVEELLDEIAELRDSVEYELKREEIYNKIFDAIKLPLVARPFKWLIKKVLKEEIEKRVSGALDALRKAI